MLVCGYLCLCACFFFSQCDPYLKITLGKKTIEDRDNYRPNTLNPEFGRSDVVEFYVTKGLKLESLSTESISICVLQNVRAVLFPAPRQRPENQCL